MVQYWFFVTRCPERMWYSVCVQGIAFALKEMGGGRGVFCFSHFLASSFYTAPVSRVHPIFRQYLPRPRIYVARCHSSPNTRRILRYHALVQFRRVEQDPATCHRRESNPSSTMGNIHRLVLLIVQWYIPRKTLTQKGLLVVA